MNVIPTAPQAKAGVYPDPWVVPPLSGTHKQTIIILHGRGDRAAQFGPEILFWSIPEHETLQKAFPDAKFIFPGAALRQAKLNNRALTSQWFDSGHPGLQQGRKYDELQIEGLRESTKFLHGLIKDAITEVGASSVVVGGLSQGGAASMAAMLLWNREPIAAWFGLCTRLPFCLRIQEALDAAEEQDGIFESSGKKHARMPRLDQAKDWMAEMIDFKDLPAELDKDNSASRGPIFLGHGTADALVPMKLGEDTTTLLRSLELQVSWNQYEGLSHWYSNDMLKDLVEFVAAHF
jgi:predicted esterase